MDPTALAAIDVIATTPAAAPGMKEAAMQATPSCGRIELKLERADAAARITITDGRQALHPHAAPHAALPDGKAPPHGTETPPGPLEVQSLIKRQGPLPHSAAGGRSRHALCRADAAARGRRRSDAVGRCESFVTLGSPAFD